MKEKGMSKKKRMAKKKDLKGGLFIFIFIGSINLFGGIIFTIYDINSIGLNLRTQQPSVMTAAMFFLWTVVCYVAAFFLYRQLKKLEK
jgi:hypothetical protein